MSCSVRKLMSECSEMSFFNNIKIGGFATKKRRQNFNVPQVTLRKGVHTAEQAVKGPEKYKMCQKSTWQH